MDRLGSYQLTGELGRGGMGVVYRGFDPLIQRAVAIKTIRLDLYQPTEYAALKQRLLREAQAAGQLSHPGIVTIYQIGEQDGVAFIAMEFVDGLPLSHLMGPSWRLPVDRISSIVAQAAAALDYAHREGVVHRDIKPANLMVTQDGRVKVTDFGIAKVSAGTLTLTGTLLGSPSYMSPEQVQTKAVDGRSDQYSLGVVAFELLTGEKPFQADTLTALAFKIAYEDPPVDRLRGHAPPGVIEVLRRALAKAPADRFPSCAAFAAAFVQAIGEPAVVEPAPAMPAEVAPAPFPETPADAPSASLPAIPPVSTALPPSRPFPPRWLSWAAAIGVAALVLSSMAAVRYLNRPAGASVPPEASKSKPEVAAIQPAAVPALDLPRPAPQQKSNAQQQSAAQRESTAQPQSSVRRPATERPSEPVLRNAPPSAPAQTVAADPPAAAPPQSEPAPAAPIPVVEAKPLPAGRNDAAPPTPPVLLQTVSPEYTEAARRAGLQGAVRLAVEIDENGGVAVQRIIRSLDPELDRRAAEAVSKWRFRPATRDGRPIRMNAEVETVFRLPAKTSGPPSLRKVPDRR
ncbi:MAG: TonB family protein [Bryobacteraceae bacterium]|nr:TonB family protein [Bryobacteraceae bacterium]